MSLEVIEFVSGEQRVYVKCDTCYGLLAVNCSEDVKNQLQDAGWTQFDGDDTCKLCQKMMDSR